MIDNEYNKKVDTVNQSLLSSQKHLICIADEILHVVTDEDSALLQKAQEMVERFCDISAFSPTKNITTEQKKKKFLFAAFSLAVMAIKNEQRVQKIIEQCEEQLILADSSSYTI